MFRMQLLNKIWQLCIGILILISPFRGVAASSCSGIFSQPGESLTSGYVYYGDDIQPHILSLLSVAKSHIDIEMYIEEAPALFAVLKEQSQNKVKIRVNLDGKSIQLPAYREKILKVQSDLESLGAEVEISDPKELQEYRKHPKAAFHRKFINVDDKFYYIGSANFREQRNLEVGYFGPLATEITFKDIFELDLKSIRENWKNSPFLKEAIESGHLADGEIQLVGPGTANPSFLDVILRGIREAKSDILISSFEASDPTILSALINKKKENPEINIKVLLCGAKINIWAGTWRFRVEKNSLYKNKLKQAGIEVREFLSLPQYNHSRLGIFDDVIYGSSADFVERSFTYSVDLGFIMRNKKIADWNKEIFNKIWSESKPSANVKLSGQIMDAFFRVFEKTATWAYALKLRMLEVLP